MECSGGRGEVWERAQRLHEKMCTNLAMAQDRLDFLGWYFSPAIITCLIIEETIFVCFFCLSLFLQLVHYLRAISCAPIDCAEKKTRNHLDCIDSITKSLFRDCISQLHHSIELRHCVCRTNFFFVFKDNVGMHCAIFVAVSMCNNFFIFFFSLSINFFVRQKSQNIF